MQADGLLKLLANINEEEGYLLPTIARKITKNSRFWESSINRCPENWRLASTIAFVTWGNAVHCGASVTELYGVFVLHGQLRILSKTHIHKEENFALPNCLILAQGTFSRG